MRMKLRKKFPLSDTDEPATEERSYKKANFFTITKESSDARSHTLPRTAKLLSASPQLKFHKRFSQDAKPHVQRALFWHSKNSP